MSLLSFLILTFVYYKKTLINTIRNAKVKINELLVQYKAFRNYVGTVQKEEVYRFQKNGTIDADYFHPALLSSTFSARNVNHMYNELKKELGEKPITIRFASDNPRNPLNKASKKESNLLQKFNNNEITEYSEIITNKDENILYYVLPTKKTTQECMKCHSNPELAPKGLIELYGDKNGFHEKVGNIRAILSTSYPLDEDLALAQKTFTLLTGITFLIFSMMLFIVYLFIKHLNKINQTLDDKVITRTKELIKEKEYIKKILDVNPSIIFVLKEGKLYNANKQFYDFLGLYNNQEYVFSEKVIEDYFLEFNNKPFPFDKKINSKIWYEYLVENQDGTHNISIDLNNTISFFLISASVIDKKNELVITLQNITEQIEKDKLLFEHSKLSSMAEMIENIAHQWRQPLSIISTSATGMLMQKEYNLLSDEQFIKSCNVIDENTQYLSRTIDEFRSFIRGDKDKVHFNLSENINIFLQLVNSSINRYQIKVIENIDNEIYLDGYSNEIVQCFVSIFTNAQYVLKKLPENERYFFISAYKSGHKVIIELKDNGGGISPDVLSRIFEPYFTTKHQAQGVGIGLHLTYNMIVDGMKGSLDATTLEYRYNNIKYKGANFKITLPLIIL
ncbi:DUF3365 domain-containing protein [Arcobacteraceae bacterium]|nr:DUF3365 domain-containing protein [Arcobacteraceae bacterium]